MMTNKSGGKTVGTVLEGLISRLEKNSDTPDMDAQVLLAHVMGQTSSWVMAHPEAS